MNKRTPYSQKVSIKWPTFVVLLTFLLNTFGPIPSFAQDYHLPAPGVMVHLSPEFNPPILKGIKVHPDNPFRFDFILDKGDDSSVIASETKQSQQERLKEESTKLIKYFLASLTIPEKDLWVNLSPYEKDRIIPNSFGLTEMGRDLLAEDYMLKQITASLIYPEDEIGKKFWKRIYEEASKRYGTTNVPINTFNKVWIVPEKAVVYENAKAGTAYVVESKLKVMLEQDYLSLENHSVGVIARCKATKQSQSDVNFLGSQIVREIVIPELTTEVNENKNFAHLRQVYNSLILATWYKKKIKDSILEQVYADKNKVAGVNIDDPQEKDKIYQRYLQAFKKGVYNYIKEDVDPTTQETIPRKYFSGGMNVTDLATKETLVDSIPAEAMVGDDRAMKVEVNTQPINMAMIKQTSNLSEKGNQALFDAWSKGPDAINDLVYQARRLGFEGGVFRLEGEFKYRLESFQGSLEDMQLGPPLFEQYVHASLVSKGWMNLNNSPGEIFRNVATHAQSDAVFMWKESEHGYECIMFDYGAGVDGLQDSPIEDLKEILSRHRSFGKSNDKVRFSGLGSWLYGKYSYLTRIISVNKGYIRVVDKKPGFFKGLDVIKLVLLPHSFIYRLRSSGLRHIFSTDAPNDAVLQKSRLDDEEYWNTSNKVTQTDLESPEESHGVITHIFVPFNKDQYKGHFSTVTKDDVLGTVVTEQAPALERDEIWRHNPSTEISNLSANDVGRPVEFAVHVSAQQNKEVKIIGELEWGGDPKSYFSLSRELYLLPIEASRGVEYYSRRILIDYSEIRNVKVGNYERKIRSEEDARSFIKDYFRRFKSDTPIEIIYEAQYDVGELRHLNGIIQEIPSADNQGTLKIRDFEGKELVFGINRIKEFKFADQAMNTPIEFPDTENMAITDALANKPSQGQLALIRSAVSFSNALIQRHPQVNSHGELNYYLVGSLSVMLLLAADEVSVIDESKLPRMEHTHQLAIPETSKGALLEFVRQIGDVDFVPLPSTLTGLHKGGNGIYYSELSDEEQEIFKEKPENSQIFFDPLQSLSHQVVKVRIGDKEFFITSPMNIIAYKALHFLEQSYNQGKADKFEKDMVILINAIEQIYSWDEIVKSVHDVMLTRAPKYPNGEYLPFESDKFHGKVRKLFEDALNVDPNASYLTKLKYARGRAVGILKILATLSTPEEKDKLIEFINKHHEDIDLWSVDTDSPRNRELMAEEIMKNNDLREELKSKNGALLGVDFDNLTKEGLVNAIRTNPWVISNFSSKLNRDLLDKIPASSELMEILITLQDVDEELSVLDKISVGHDNRSFSLRRILTVKDGEFRGMIYQTIRLGQEKLDAARFQQFLSALYNEIIYSDKKLEKIDGKIQWVDISREMKVEYLTGIRKDFGFEDGAMNVRVKFNEDDQMKQSVEKASNAGVVFKPFTLAIRELYFPEEDLKAQPNSEGIKPNGQLIEAVEGKSEINDLAFELKKLNIIAIYDPTDMAFHGGEAYLNGSLAVLSLSREGFESGKITEAERHELDHLTQDLFPDHFRGGCG